MANTTVVLYSPELNEEREHDIEHAARIFQIPNHGWILKDSKFEFKDGNIVRASSGKAKDAKEQGTAEHSDTA
jgi:hypothetical protein